MTFGPCHTDGNCCGPGSYCCGHPEQKPHDHPELDDEEDEPILRPPAAAIARPGAPKREPSYDERIARDIQEQTGLRSEAITKMLERAAREGYDVGYLQSLEDE